MALLQQIDQLRSLAEQPLLVFVLVLTRVGTLVMTAPIFGSNEVPRQVRALLALLLSALVMPLYWNTPIETPGNIVNGLVILGSEALIGLALGLGVMIVFGGVQMAGQLIGQLAGMSLADVFSPGFGDRVPVISQFLFYVAMAVFVVIGGHRQVVGALLDTFESLPIGTGGVPTSIADTMVTLIAHSFELGVRAAAPVMAAVLMAIIVVGLIGRTVPQMNIMALGFSLYGMVALASLSVVIGSMAWIFQDQVDVVLETLAEALTRNTPGGL